MRTSGVRANLGLRVVRTPSEGAKRAALLLHLAKPGAAIVYTSTVKRTEELWSWIVSHRADVGRYHGELPDDVRVATQAAFMDGRYG